MDTTLTPICVLQISTLQSQIHCQESDLLSQEEELSRAKTDLNRLQQEENQLEQSLAAGKIQLETIIKSLKATQDEINQVRRRFRECAVSRKRYCTSETTCFLPKAMLTPGSKCTFE